MEHYDLTFRFDDAQNSLTNYNGLSVETFGAFLKSLADAVDDSTEKTLVVSEIKGNCYAPVLSSSSVTQFNNIKVLHECISSNNYSGLTEKEIKYAKNLKAILGNKFHLDVYNEDKQFYQSIKEIEIDDKPRHYYESTTITGILTRIGSKSIDGKPKIHISDFSNEIEITPIQDDQLKDFYRKGIIECYVVKKVNADKGNIESALLDGFKYLGQPEKNTTFIDSLISVRNKFGSAISAHINTESDDYDTFR